MSIVPDTVEGHANGQVSGLTPWAMLVSEGHTDAQGLVCHLRPCLCPRAMLPLGPY